MLKYYFLGRYIHDWHIYLYEVNLLTKMKSCSTCYITTSIFHSIYNRYLFMSINVNLQKILILDLLFFPFSFFVYYIYCSGHTILSTSHPKHNSGTWNEHFPKKTFFLVLYDPLGYSEESPETQEHFDPLSAPPPSICASLGRFLSFSGSQVSF